MFARGPFEPIELGVITIKRTYEGPEGHRSPSVTSVSILGVELTEDISTSGPLVGSTVPKRLIKEQLEKRHRERNRYHVLDM